MPLSDIVSVNITTQTQQITQAGFVTPMILGVHKRFNELIKFYSSLNSVGADFASTDPEYIAAQDMFSQSLSPNLIAIGRRLTANATIDVIGAESGQNYTTTVNGENYTIDSTTTGENSFLTLSADLVENNVINCKINGTSITPVTFTSPITTHLQCITAVAAAIAAADTTNVLSAVVTGSTDRQIQVTAKTNKTAVLSDFVVTLGASQATGTIVLSDTPTTSLTIAASMVAAIQGDSARIVNATDNLDGTYTLAPRVAGTPYTLAVSTDIVDPTFALVEVTQVVPVSQYFVTINGLQISYIAPYNVATNEQIAASLVALINLQTATTNVAATDNLDGTFDLASTNSNSFKLLVQANTMAATYGLNIEPYVASQSITQDLTDIDNVNSDWYALSYTRRDSSDVLLAAAWIQSNVKIFGTASDDLDIINLPYGSGDGFDTTSIAALLNNAGYTRTFSMYHQDAAHDYPECAWLARVLPLDPGSETWKFKTLNSISTSNLTETQSQNALAKKCNVYQNIGGVGITRNGTVASGEWIDIIRGIDWLTARIQENVYSLLVNTNKVPYTDTGAAMVQSQVQAALQLGVDNNFLSSNPAPKVTVPKVSTISSIVKASRVLPDVNFTATLAGAIQQVQINGIVSL